MTNALIIGYGRAGKRHGKILDELGIEWMATDPYAYEMELEPRIMYEDLTEALAKVKWDRAIIATPPALHLTQIRQCLDAGLPVLCEKPLCSLGQLDEARELLNHPNADKVMVAFNYRYHPRLIRARGRIPFYFTCLQDRELPEWGLLLDHASHDLDILRFLCGDIDIVHAKHIEPGWYNHDPKRDTWVIKVAAGDEEVVIRESVGNYFDRRAKLEYWQGDYIDIDPDPAMFTAMYEAFLSGRYESGLTEAIKTQELLEKCEELANVES